MTTEIIREIYTENIQVYEEDFAGAVWNAVNRARALYPEASLVRVSVLNRTSEDEIRHEIRIQVTMKREDV